MCAFLTITLQLPKSQINSTALIEIALMFPDAVWYPILEVQSPSVNKVSTEVYSFRSEV